MAVQDAIYSPTDLVEADRLISDLAVLLDAGLVAVRESRLGPARYGVVSELDDSVDRSSASADRDTPAVIRACA